MATFNTIEELIQILDENPHWLEALRARLLTRELLELPQRHAEFVKLSEQRHREVRADIKGIRGDINGIRDDIGILKGYATEAAIIRFADDVTIELGLRRVRSLSVNQLMEMVDSADTTGMFDSPQSRRDNLRSFRRADLIMEARDPKEPNGETCYVAVESSYTVNGRDTRRAMRNAGYLEKFTQKKAHAVVAGVHLDDRVREDVESGRVFWYEVEEHAIRHD